MCRRSLKFISNFVWLWFLFVWQALSLAETILYPGSFNPFHRTHFEEVENALSLKPGGRIIILPIEEAAYTRDIDNQPLRVRLFSFPQELSFIAKSFEDNPRVQASDDLRIISGDPVESLLTYSKSISDPDLFILVGPEVVEKWVVSPQFNQLLDRARLIVTTDPKDQMLTDSIKRQFQTNERLLFNELPTSGIRGGDVRNSVASRPHSSTHELFSPKLGKYFQNHPNVLPDALEDYRKRLIVYLERDLQQNILPAIVENGLPRRVGEFFIQNPSLASPLFAINPDDMASVAEAAEKLRSHLPQTLQKAEAQTFILDLVSAISEPRLFGLLKSRSGTTERMLFRILNKSSFPPPKNKEELKRKSIFFDPFGTWHGFLTSLMKPLTQLNISDPPEITALSRKESKGYIEVYRGVKNRANLDPLIQDILRLGFVSKVALKSSQSGAPNGGISSSEQDLLKRGIQSALLEHIFGDYHNTSPFVATTLKKEIAEGFAGKEGYVFKIRVPINEGYFLNDLVFWKNTPWEKTGNPFRYLNEFIVPHKIGADQILEAYKVVEEPLPLPTVPLIQRTQSLKIIPFKFRTALEQTTIRWCTHLFQAIH